MARERTKRFDRRVDAEKWLSTNGADIARGAWVDPAAGEITFRQYVKTWRATKADVSDRTLINIEGRLDNYAIPYLGDMQMSSVQPSDIRAFVANIVKGLAPSTVKAIYNTTSQIFAQGVLDGLGAKSPRVGISLPRERYREEMHSLSPDQVNDVAAAVDERYRALIYTAAYAGLRSGELVALRVEAMKLGVLGGTIAVNGSASEVRGRLVFGPTKAGRNRVVAIPLFLSAMLAEHIQRYPRSKASCSRRRGGGPLRHRNFYQRHFRPAVAAARKHSIQDGPSSEALPESLRFHDLRHTCAAILIANGRHMEEVKDYLGHSSIRATSDRYGHLFPSAKAALAESLDVTFRRPRAAVTAAVTDKRRTIDGRSRDSR